MDLSCRKGKKSQRRGRKSRFGPVLQMLILDIYGKMKRRG
ncbi:hypothetical protein RSK20926_20900 [Roseobacter sp. SK209-2-6]|nr:hypothetical protein RSK20926_20900 [Roseobacter sp. SK209-2-6]